MKAAEIIHSPLRAADSKAKHYIENSVSVSIEKLEPLCAMDRNIKWKIES